MGTPGAKNWDEAAVEPAKDSPYQPGNEDDASEEGKGVGVPPGSAEEEADTPQTPAG